MLSHSLVSDQLCNPMGYSCQAPLSMGILQLRILKWVAVPSSRGSSHTRDWTQVSCIAGRFFTVWATREAQSVVELGFDPWQSKCFHLPCYAATADVWWKSPFIIPNMTKGAKESRTCIIVRSDGLTQLLGQTHAKLSGRLSCVE